MRGSWSYGKGQDARASYSALEYLRGVCKGDTMKPNAQKLRILANSLRLMACAAENASSARDMRGLILGLQAAISLASLCLFNWNRKIIENAAFEIDPTEAIR